MVKEIKQSVTPTPGESGRTRTAGRPRILDGETCYLLFTRLGSIRAVQQYLHEAGVIPPRGKSGLFAQAAIANAIRLYKPDAVLGTMSIRVAQQQMLKLRQQVLSAEKKQPEK